MYSQNVTTTYVFLISLIEIWGKCVLLNGTSKMSEPVVTFIIVVRHLSNMLYVSETRRLTAEVLTEKILFLNKFSRTVPLMIDSERQSISIHTM